MDEERVVYKIDRYRRYHIMLSTEFETHSRKLFKLLLPAAVCVSRPPARIMFDGYVCVHRTHMADIYIYIQRSMHQQPKTAP